MAQFNRQALLRSLYAYREQLDAIVADIEAEDWAGLFAKLEKNTELRASIVD